MVKKHQRRYIYICDQTKNIFEAARELSNLPKNIQIWKKTCANKVITLFNYWSNQMEKLIAAVKIFLLTRLRLQQYICKFMKAFSYLRLSNKERKICIKKNEISVGSCTSISHISQNCSSV